MGIISNIGRKNPKVRAWHFSIYTILILGSLTMIYPFLLMIGGSTRSAVDLREKNLIPQFLINDNALYRKHIEALFNESLSAMRMAHNVDFNSFEKVIPPENVQPKYIEEWLNFLKFSDLPDYAFTLGYVRAQVSRTMPGMLRIFKHELQRNFDGDIAEMNKTFRTEFENWNAFYLVPENYLARRNMPVRTPLTSAFTKFKNEQSQAFRYVFLADGFYRREFLRGQYTRDIAEYNLQHQTTYETYAQMKLTRTFPSGDKLTQNDWENFVRTSLNLLWLRVSPEAKESYQEFLAAKYGKIDILNSKYGTNYQGFNHIPLIKTPPLKGLAYSDWAAFIVGWKDPESGKIHQPKVEHLGIHSVGFMFQDHLQSKYKDITGINRALGTQFAAIRDIIPPQREAHYVQFLEKRGELRWEFTSRNFKTVIDYIILHGRGLLNTTIYCSLAILFALLVNPMAAYAMSRYKMPANYKILLFMLVTMSFPPMVTQIPVFLMLRDLHLLNTFAALLLPGLANGYSIFLLKGFFDSLPRELYESAAIDGAGEWTMFWQITMSLSRPILAVIALQAFTLAYANFMFALLICQDEKMWTLMVWLYQLHQRSGQSVVYASLLIAAIPTFVIFVFCQKIIMRGIVIPVER